MAGIKIRAKAKDDIVTVKVLMNHDMESGRRKDKKTGAPIPAHFIKTVTITANDKTVLTADWTGSISKNPYLSCKYKGAAKDSIKVSWVDNKGETAEESATAK